MHFGSRFVQLRQAALSCSVLVIGSQYRVNSVMSSLRLYCDGLVDKGKWCVGLTWIEFVTCNSNVTSQGENDIHGYCGDSTYIFQSDNDHNDVGIGEALALVHAIWYSLHFEDKDHVTVVSDRLATMRTLQNLQGQLLHNTSFHNCLKYLRLQVSRALNRHGSINFVYHKCLGLNDKWRPDYLSRIIQRVDALPKPVCIPSVPTDETATRAICCSDEWLSSAKFHQVQFDPPYKNLWAMTITSRKGGVKPLEQPRCNAT